MFIINLYIFINLSLLIIHCRYDNVYKLFWNTFSFIRTWYENPIFEYMLIS